MKLPNFLDSQVIDKNGYLTDTWRQIITQLFSYLQINISDEGFIIPTQPTDNLSIVQKDNLLLVDSDDHRLKIYLNGIWKKIVTE